MKRFRPSPFLFVALALVVVALAVSAGSASAGVDDGVGVVKLWQVKEAPAYVPVLRDDAGMWRSVTMPPAEFVQQLLQDQGKISLNASPEEVQAATAAWYKGAQKDAYIGADPAALRKLLAREKALLSGDVAAADLTLPTPKKDLLGVVVTFDGTDTVTRPYPDPNTGKCVDTPFTWGPLGLNQDPPPGPQDNFRFYKPGISVADYEEAMFGEGPNAGYGVFTHPVLGQVDLRGYTLQNYLLEMSRGTYRAGGGVLADAVSVPHSHEYYGYARYSEDTDGNCVSPTFSDANYGQYLRDVVAATSAKYDGTLDWSQYDADGDHIIDLLFTIHAGYGFQEGGGEDRLSTSSSSFPEPVQIGGATTPADPSDDYFVRGFNVAPEQLDVGGIQEEFEHQFGLPDIYTTDRENSNAWWGAHSAGVWGGPLGSTRPVGHNLWQDYVLGWRSPKVINYDSPELVATLGRARYTPAGTEDGLIVKLPEKGISVANEAGEGKGWWSDSADDLDNTVERSFDLSAVTGQPIFSFSAFWGIEEDYDYGYVEASTDAGATWTSLPDMDGVLTDTNPNGSNLGWGLTGASAEATTLRFDLSAYKGKTIGLRFRYRTDPGVSEPGWWVDDLSLDDGATNLYKNDLETDFSDWTNAGWMVVPFTQIAEQYYLAEWRDNNGFDKSLNDPYQGYYDTDGPPQEFVVDRLPATAPGMTITYRDASQKFDSEVSSDICAAPSCGTKYPLIVVDSHNMPKRFDTKFPNYSGGFVGVRVSDRVQPGDAAFGQTPTSVWTGRLGFNYTTGQYVQPPLETKTWPSEAAIPAFHDSFGYYPGFFYPGTGSSVYYSYFSSSAALPAKGNYTTQVTHPDGSPFPELYGTAIGPGGLGSGNPGDDNVQYGIHLQVLNQSHEQATVKFWNALYEVEASGKASVATAAVGDEVGFDFTGQNVGGAANWFFMIPLPAGTTYVDGSAYGGLTPVADMAAAEAAVKSGASVAALAAPSAANVTGFVWLYYVPTGASTPFGFKVIVGEEAAGTILRATATAYDLYNDATYLQPYRTVTAGDVRVAAIVTVTLPLMYDTWVNGGATATNYNSYAALIGRTTGLDNVLLTFDRSLLPAGQVITAAELKVNVSGQSGQFGKSLVAANVNAFDPTKVTYANAPLIFNPSAAVAVPNANGSMTFDVTSQVTAWGAAGNSLAISAAGPGGRVILDSLESYQSQPATLTLTY